MSLRRIATIASRGTVAALTASLFCAFVLLTSQLDTAAWLTLFCLSMGITAVSAIVALVMHKMMYRPKRSIRSAQR